MTAAAEPSSKHEPRILRLQHVALPFPGTDEARVEARRFYGRVLGLKEKPVPPELQEAVLWYAAGAQEIHIFPEPSGVAVNSHSRRHACLQVDDVRAFRARLAGEGVTTISGQPEIPGRPRFFAMDPFGNAIEFVELEADH